MRALLTGFLLSNSPDFRSRKATWLRMIKDPRTRALSQQLLQHRLECEVGFSCGLYATRYTLQIADLQ
jgi:hypothetical protein